jgi:hypothetical protein
MPRFLDSMGYYISGLSFEGPFLEVADITSGKDIELPGMNLYCVKKTLRDANAMAKGRRLHHHA